VLFHGEPDSQAMPTPANASGHRHESHLPSDDQSRRARAWPMLLQPSSHLFGL
jgi:hypothetical protein